MPHPPLATPRHERRIPLNPLFARSPDPMVIVRPDGQILRVNPAFIAALGHAEPDLCARNLLDLLHPDDHAPAQAALANRIPTAPIETRFFCASGGYKSLDWTATPDPARGLAYIVARKKLRNEPNCVCALEYTTDAFFAVDTDWRLIRVNQQAETLWSRQRGDLLGRHLWEVFPEAARSPLRAVYEQVMRTGEPAHLEEFHPYPPPGMVRDPRLPVARRAGRILPRHRRPPSG